MAASSGYDTDVLVVGSGPTGATAALALAGYGVRALVVSRWNWLADSPRAHITNQRTNEVFRDLGIDDGTPRSVYTLDPSGMTQIAGGDSGTPAIQLMPGQTEDLPNGLGTITFEDEAPAGATGYEQSVKRFASLSIHRDLAQC